MEWGSYHKCANPNCPWGDAHISPVFDYCSGRCRYAVEGYPKAPERPAGFLRKVFSRWNHKR